MGIVLIQLAWASGELWLLEPQLSHAVGFAGCSVLLLSALAYAPKLLSQSNQGRLSLGNGQLLPSSCSYRGISNHLG